MIKLPLYNYKVVDSQGVAREGQLAAQDENSLTDKLRQMSYTIIDVSLHHEEAPDDVLTRDVGVSMEMGVSRKNLVFFTRQLATTLNAGLPLTRIITTLYNQTSSKSLKKILHQLGRDIQLGESLSAAMAKHKGVFDDMFLSMVSVGEASGNLPETVSKLADMMEKDQQIRRKVKAALTYPTFIVAFSAILSYVLVAMLIPGFIPIFKSTGLDLARDYPITDALIKLSAFLTNPVVLGISVGGLLLLLILVKLLGKSSNGRFFLDSIKFNFPFLQHLVRLGAVTRFCRAFATLSRSGVSLLKSLSLVGGASGNVVVDRAAEKISKEISEGERLSVAMKKSSLFPELVIQMVSVGEESGTVPDMLDRTSEYFEQEMEGSIESIMSLMEPVMMIIVGIIVGVFVMGILLPILGIAGKFGQG